MKAWETTILNFSRPRFTMRGLLFRTWSWKVLWRVLTRNWSTLFTCLLLVVPNLDGRNRIHISETIDSWLPFRTPERTGRICWKDSPSADGHELSNENRQKAIFALEQKTGDRHRKCWKRWKAHWNARRAKGGRHMGNRKMWSVHGNGKEVIGAWDRDKGKFWDFGDIIPDFFWSICHRSAGHTKEGQSVHEMMWVKASIGWGSQVFTKYMHGFSICDKWSAQAAASSAQRDLWDATRA